MGDAAKSRPLYELVIKVEPDNVLALNNLAFALAEEGGDLNLALTYAQRARQKSPESPEIADTLGWVYVRKNLSDNAIRIFQELVRKDPNHSTWRFHLAAALYQKGDKPSARRELEAALRSKPNRQEEQKIRELLTKTGT
jgi:tetratricopeptide (TPR) repeat protein